MFSEPLRPSPTRLVCTSASLSCAITACSCGSRERPAAVSLTRWARRSNKGVPISSSRSAMICDTAGRVTCRRSEARPKCSSSAAAMK